MRIAPARILMAVAAATFAAGVQASSFVGSSAQSGVEGSRGSSDSVRLSSNSSAGDNTAAIRDGTYRVAQVDELAGDDALLLTLAPHRMTEPAQAVQLEVPRQAFGGAWPDVGELVQAQRRDYGVQFVRGDQPDPFFMVVADAILPELDARPLTP